MIINLPGIEIYKFRQIILSIDKRISKTESYISNDGYFGNITKIELKILKDFDLKYYISKPALRTICNYVKTYYNLKRCKIKYKIINNKCIEYTLKYEWI